jgi:hypothetical protein
MAMGNPPNLRIGIDDLNDMRLSPAIFDETTALMKKIISNGGKVIILQKYVNAPADLHAVLATEDQLEAFTKSE